MGWLGWGVLIAIVYWLVSRHQKAQEARVEAILERESEAHKAFIALLLDRTEGGIYEGWEAGTRALMQRGVPFHTAKRITESVIRERLGVDEFDYERTLFELEPRLRATFGQPEPGNRGSKRLTP
jgi:hypothetical protein